MMKTLLMSAGAAGAVGVAIVAAPRGDAEGQGEPSPGIELCLKGELPLFEGVSAKCFSRSELLGLRDRRIMDMQGRAVSLSMSHPSDKSVPARTCRTCRDYGEMSFDGWYALSSRDMRREAYFIRACGVLAALTNARAAQRSFFTDGSPSPRDVADLANDMQFGEGLSIGDNVVVEKTAGAVWRISSDVMTIQIHEIANADFDNDGVEEIIVFTAGAPEGGTAAFYSAGIIEKDDAGARLSFTPLSYGPEKAAGPGF